MKYFTEVAIIATTAILIGTLIGLTSIGRSCEREAFEWVANHINVDVSDEPTPNIQYRSRQEMYHMMIGVTALVGYCEEVKYLPKEIDGMFLVINKIIYVNEVLEGCEKQAVLVHEFVHFLQDASRLDTPHIMSLDPTGVFEREMQAGSIQVIFEKEVCE